MYFLQYVDQLSINSQPPIVRQKKCYFIARCCLVSFHLMKNRWDSNPWDTSALSLGREKLCPHLPKKPSNNKLCTDISVGIAFGLVTPLVPKSVLKKKCACINKFKNTFLNLLPNFCDVSKVKHNNVGIIIFNTDWHAYWATQGAAQLMKKI